MDIPPWHLRTTITNVGRDYPLTTLLDAVRIYCELPPVTRGDAVVSIVEPGREGILDSDELDALVSQLPPID